MRDIRYLPRCTELRLAACAIVKCSGSKGIRRGQQLSRGAEDGHEACSIIGSPIVGVQGPEKDEVKWPIHGAGQRCKAIAF
jgi:hypothetical protein